MAVRRPLYVTAGGHLQEMTTAQVDQIIAQTCYQYSLNPSVVLAYTASGGSVGTISDTRLQAGTYVTRAGDGVAGDAGLGEYYNAANTPDISTVTVNHSKINQTLASVSDFSGFTAKSLPLYWNGSGLQMMTNEDIYNTFVEPAIDILASSSTTAAQGGTYQIYSSTSLSGNTLVSGSPVFSDTRANTSLYTAGGIPEAQDQPTTISNFYLFIINGSEASYTRPVGFTGGLNFQTHTKSEFDSALQTFVRYAAVNRANYKIRYSYSTGSNRGSGMTDTKLNGSGAYTTFFAGVNDYRSQEFPNGTAVTVNTYYLKIAKSA